MCEYIGTWDNEHGALWGEYLEPWGQESYVYFIKEYKEYASKNKRFRYFVCLSFNGELNCYDTNLKRLHMKPLKHGWGGCGDYTYGGESIYPRKKDFIEWCKSKGMQPIKKRNKRRVRYGTKSH